MELAISTHPLTGDGAQNPIAGSMSDMAMLRQSIDHLYNLPATQ